MTTPTVSVSDTIIPVQSDATVILWYELGFIYERMFPTKIALEIYLRNRYPHKDAEYRDGLVMFIDYHRFQ